MKKFTLFLLTLMVSVLSSFAQEPSAPKFSPLATDGETVQYLYNVETHTFMLGANDWNTRASVSVEKGYQFKIADNGNGTYTLNDYVENQSTWKAVFADNPTGIWVDNLGGANVKGWVITSVGDNLYKITNPGAGAGELSVVQDLSDTRLYLNVSNPAAYAATWALVSEADYTAYIETLDAAAVNAYAASKKEQVGKALQSVINEANYAALAARTAIANGTNVYGEGYDAWVAKTAELAALVDAGNYTEKIVNPNAATGWHASTEFNFLLTPWTTGGQAANNFEKNLYINTWSTEGVGDGTGFLVPFFEYWTGDDASLAANELATTVSGLTPGAEYSTSVWARVRIKNNGGTDAHGITFVAGGEPVDVCAGEGPAQFRLIKAVATGVADEEGKLKIAFNINADNNVSWLSYKDVYYAEAKPECPAITFDVAEDAEVDLDSVKSIHISIATPEGAEEADDLFIEGVLLGIDGTNQPIFSFSDFEDGVEVPISRLTPGNAYSINITKIAYGKEVGFDEETYMPIYENEIKAAEGEALASLNFALKAPSAPEVGEITAVYNSAGPVIVITFEDQKDVVPSWNVDILLNGEKVSCEYGQEWNEIYAYPGAALADGEYTLVFPVGSLTFDSSVDNDTECSVTFTVGNPTPELAVSLVAEDETEYALNTHSTVTVDMALKGIVVTGLDQVMDEVTYAILGKNKTTVASGTLSVNTIGYAEFVTLVNLYEGNDYQIVVATEDSTLFDCAVIGAAEPAEIEISATLDGEVSINSHSEVSVEKASSIEVTFDGVVPTEAGFSVISMKNEETEEGLLWEVDEVLEQGMLSLNGKGYAEFEQTQYFEAGSKYLIVVSYATANSKHNEINYVINGAYGSAPELADGTYFIQNVESGLFMAGNNSWGTQASAVAAGDEFAVTLADGVYTITGTSLTSANKTLGYNLFVDTNVSQNGNTWTIAPVEGEEGVYTIYGKGMKDKVEDAFEGYIAQSETAGAVTGYVLEGVAEITDAAKWRFVTKAELTAEIEAGDDVTYLISNANFTRNHATSDWIVDEGCTNKNLGGGENANFCAESYHSKFNIHQTIENAPNGFYTLTAQGFYRNDFKDGETHETPVFYANSEEIAIPVKTGEENSMSDASRSFTNGLYTIDPIQFEVTDGTITIGVKSDEAEYWCIWDNFQLTYLGEEAPAEIAVTLVANDSVEYLLNTHSVVTIDQPISAIKVAGLDQVMEEVSYAIYGMDKATLAAGLLSVNTIGYAEFAPVTLYEGNQYNVVVTVGENTVFDQIVIGAAEPAEIEIAATINDSIALNTHSAISAESIKAIEVSFEGFTPTQAGFSINTLVQVADSAAESSSWEIGETLAQGVLSLNGKGYAELEEAIVLNAGTKYCVIINAGNESATFEINGAYEEEIDENLIEIAQTIDADQNLACQKTEEEGNTKYVSGADISLMYKMLNVDVNGCDYIVVKFSAPAPEGVKLAFWNGQEMVDVTPGATEYKYVFADDAACAIKDGIIPQVTMLTTWNPGKEINVAGVYKHAIDITGINAVATASKANGKYIENGKVVIVKNGVKYNVAGSIIK